MFPEARAVERGARVMWTEGAPAARPDGVQPVGARPTRKKVSVEPLLLRSTWPRGSTTKRIRTRARLARRAAG